MGTYPPQGNQAATGATPVRAEPGFVATEYGSGLSDEEVWRCDPGAGSALNVYRAGLQPKGGSAVAASVEFHDVSTGGQIAAVSANSAAVGSPIGSGTAGSAVLARLTTPSAASAVLSLNVDARIE